MKKIILYLFVSLMSCAMHASQQSTARSTTRAQQRLHNNATAQELAEKICLERLQNSLRSQTKKEAELDIAAEQLILEMWRVRVHLLEQQVTLTTQSLKTQTTLVRG